MLTCGNKEEDEEEEDDDRSVKSSSELGRVRGWVRCRMRGCVKGCERG